MLTDQQARHLLQLAADTVPVPSDAPSLPPSRRTWPLVAAAASVALVLAATVVVPRLLSGSGAPGPSSEPCAFTGVERTASEGPSIPLGPDYPTNADGLTYGSAPHNDRTAEEPDLIAAYGDCGRVGYIHREALDEPAPWSPEAGLPAGRPRTVPVYEADGTTQIDTFTIGRGDQGNGSSPRPTGSQPTSGPDAAALLGIWSVIIVGIQGEDGTQQYDTFRDVELTARFDGDELTVWDGCRTWTTTYRLVSGQFSLTSAFTAPDPVPAGCDREAPLTNIFENIRHVSRSGAKVHLVLDNFGIALVLTPDPGH